MRYIFLTLIFIIGFFVNISLFNPNFSYWVIGSILIIDAGLLAGLAAIYIYYWSREFGNKARYTKAGTLIMGWIGLIFIYLGAYIFISGDYFLEGERLQTAFLRELLNSIGDLFGAEVVGAIWLLCGLLILFFSIRTFSKA